MTLQGFIIQFIIAIVLAVVAYLLAPQPRAAKNENTRDLDAPTADAGRPLPVVFGDLTIKSPNCLGYWDISKEVVKVKQ